MSAIEKGLAVCLVLTVAYIALEVWIHNRRVDNEQ